MDRKLIEKICVFLLNNNVKASDIYFHHEEIFTCLANIENNRKGIIPVKNDESSRRIFGT